MASESRQLPNSNKGRLAAQKAARDKNTAMGAGSFLTTPTKNRLTAIVALYIAAYDVIALKKHDMVVLTAQKTGFADVCRMMCSHFIQVFNLAVERGVFPKEDRTFYQLSVDSPVVPEMNTDAEILQVASDLITGEANRVAAGGAAMAMPAIADVITAHTNLNGIMMPHSTAVDAYDQSLEDLDALNVEADAVIKKVWDEVETFYNEEEPSSQRANARQWGVIYVLRGSLKTVSGTVTDIDTGAIIPGAKIFFFKGNKTVITDEEGNYTTTTTLMGDQHLLAESNLYDDYDETVTLVENENLVWDIKMKKSV